MVSRFLLKFFWRRLRRQALQFRFGLAGETRRPAELLAGKAVPLQQASAVHNDPPFALDQEARTASGRADRAARSLGASVPIRTLLHSRRDPRAAPIAPLWDSAHSREAALMLGWNLEEAGLHIVRQ
jgi:hypothetical protein